MVEVVAASERAKIPAGTAVKIPLQVTKSVVPTNSSVCLETARQHDIMTSSQNHHHDAIDVIDVMPETGKAAINLLESETSLHTS